MYMRDIGYARNVSLLFNFEALRAPHMRGDRFDKSFARSSGFQLNSVSSALDGLLYGFFREGFLTCWSTPPRSRPEVPVATRYVGAPSL